jgi:hypothetical protein
MGENAKNNSFHCAVIKLKKIAISYWDITHATYLEVSPCIVIWHRWGLESYFGNKPKSTVDATFTNIW